MYCCIHTKLTGYHSKQIECHKQSFIFCFSICTIYYNIIYKMRSITIKYTHNINHTATILLGSTLTLMNMVSSFMKCLFFIISWETNLGKPKPKESGSKLGLWKFFHVGSGMKLSTILQAFSGQVDWSNKVKETEWEKGQRRRASYSPGKIFM